MMKAYMSIVFILVFRIFLPPLSGSENDSPENLIRDSLESYSSFVSHQKVFLHLDKSSYLAGQTIWFRAYLLDGMDNIPVRSKNNLFVDLIDSRGEAIAVRMLLAEEGGAHGDILLADDIPDGNYILRAYTSWMRNFGEEYYFTRQLYIRNPAYKNMIPRIEVIKNRFFNRRLERMGRNYEVVFFPEGGNMLAGTPNRVAFKATDELGRGQSAEGKIIDMEGNVVATLETDFAGIGIFNIEPMAENVYRAVVSVNGGRQTAYDFPKASDQGYALRIDEVGEQINIKLATNRGSLNSLYSEEVIIVAHTRGKVHFARSFMISNNRLEVNVDKELFSTGIAHFTVFTNDYIPVAERLVFIDRKDELIFSAEIDTVTLFEGDHINFRLKASDKAGNPVEGTFSLSAVTGAPDITSHSRGILSYILFNSDIAEMVDYPDVYFKMDDENIPTADHLLLTYGWRRFNWENVLAGDLPRIRYSGEPGLAITGKVKDPAANMPIQGHPVQLTVKSGYDEEFTSITDQHGYFAFPHLYFEGVVRMELSGRRLASNYPPEIELNVQEAWGHNYQPGVQTRKRMVTRRGDDWVRKPRQPRSAYISAPGRIAAPQEFGRPDQTIFIDHENLFEHDILELLKNKAVGLIVDGESVRLHGPTSFYGRIDVEYMINGRFVDRRLFLSTPLRDIERIEIYRHSSTVAFGSRGGSGVINVSIKEPGYMGFRDILNLTVQGYHEVRDFYSDIITYQRLSADPAYGITVYWEPDLVTGVYGSVNFHLPVNEGVSRLIFTIQGAGYNGSLGFSRMLLAR